MASRCQYALAGVLILFVSTSVYGGDGTADKMQNTFATSNSKPLKKSAGKVIQKVAPKILSRACPFGGCYHGKKIYDQGAKYSPDNRAKRNGFKDLDDLIEQSR